LPDLPRVTTTDLLYSGALPAAALAAPDPDPAKLVGVTELDPATGRAKQYFIGRGEVAPNAIVVTNVGDAPVKGVVVQVRILNDLDFAKKYQNCWYAVDSNLDAAWCSFDDQLAGEPTPTATVTPTAGSDGGAPATTPPTTGKGGGLAITGTQAATVAGVGGALLLIGGMGYLIAHRRRTRFVA
jgi:hypothetical protein